MKTGWMIHEYDDRESRGSIGRTVYPTRLQAMTEVETRIRHRGWTKTSEGGDTTVFTIHTGHRRFEIWEVIVKESSDG